jgi:hypothetical protein
MATDRTAALAEAYQQLLLGWYLFQPGVIPEAAAAALQAATLRETDMPTVLEIHQFVVALRTEDVTVIPDGLLAELRINHVPLELLPAALNDWESYQPPRVRAAYDELVSVAERAYSRVK